MSKGRGGPTSDPTHRSRADSESWWELLGGKLQGKRKALDGVSKKKKKPSESTHRKSRGPEAEIVKRQKDTSTRKSGFTIEEGGKSKGRGKEAEKCNMWLRGVELQLH